MKTSRMQIQAIFIKGQNCYKKLIFVWTTKKVWWKKFLYLRLSDLNVFNTDSLVHTRTNFSEYLFSSWEKFCTWHLWDIHITTTPYHFLYFFHFHEFWTMSFLDLIQFGITLVNSHFNTLKKYVMIFTIV